MQKRRAVWSGYSLHALRHGAGSFIWQQEGGMKDLYGLGGAAGRESL